MGPIDATYPTVECLHSLDFCSICCSLNESCELVSSLDVTVDLVHKPIKKGSLLFACSLLSFPFLAAAAACLIDEKRLLFFLHFFPRFLALYFFVL